MNKPFYDKSIKERAGVEEPAIEFAQRRGWWHTKVGSLTRNGQPDDLFVRAGVYLWIEFKAAGQEPTVQQLKRHKEMRERGMDVRWTDSLHQAKEWLQ
jgi:hypothetical protein